MSATSGKQYIGTPGPKPRVSVLENGKRRRLNGPWAWGDKSANAAALALALLTDLLNDWDRANALYRRFLWRAVVEWASDKPWRKTEAELLAVVQDIEQTEAETAALRSRIAKEPTPVAVEGGVGVGGGKIGFTTR